MRRLQEQEARAAEEARARIQKEARLRDAEKRNAVTAATAEVQSVEAEKQLQALAAAAEAARLEAEKQKQVEVRLCASLRSSWMRPASHRFLVHHVFTLYLFDKSSVFRSCLAVAFVIQ